MDSNEFGLVVRGARERRGWSQQRLGQEVGVRQSHIARVEAGLDVQLSTAKRILDKLGCQLVVKAPSARDLFLNPPEGGAIAAARDFGIDLGQLYSSRAMAPADRLEAAVSGAHGLAALFG